MANNANNRTMLSELPLEIQLIIIEHILEDCRLWVGNYEGQTRGVIGRFISVDQPEGNHPPHSLYYVNHSLAQQIRQLWQRRFNNELEVDTFLPSFPPQIFAGIIYLSITMTQAAQSLQVTVPHLPRDYDHMISPVRQLVLTHAPAIQRLNIQWNITYHIDANGMHGPLFASTDQEIATQTVLVRLQYFLRPFSVTINFHATGRGLLLATGAIIPTDCLSTFGDFTFQYHGQMNDVATLQAGLEWNLRNFGWDPLLTFNHTSPQWLAVIEAHPHYDFAPLGWQEGSFLFSPPIASSSAAPPRKFSQRRDRPRPFDDNDNEEV